MIEQHETDFDALRAFKAMTPDERVESLFLNQREVLRGNKDICTRLDIANGTMKRTKDQLTAHLEEHKMELAGINFIKRWGGYGTALMVAALAILGLPPAIQTFLNLFG